MDGILGLGIRVQYIACGTTEGIRQYIHNDLVADLGVGSASGSAKLMAIWVPQAEVQTSGLKYWI